MKRGTDGVRIVNIRITIATGSSQNVSIVSVIIVAGAQPLALIQTFALKVRPLKSRLFIVQVE